MNLVALILLVLGYAQEPVNKDILLGHWTASNNSLFAKVDKKFTDKPDIYLNKEALSAFEKMHAEALKAGIKLNILSAARNFKYQKSIWETKWNKTENKKLSPVERIKKILEYSAMPGCSRHHWGTDIDLNSLSPSYFEGKAGKKIYDWLTKNAKQFGFAQPYTSKTTGRTGYNEEKWHWSYLPIAQKYLTNYASQVTYTDIKDFSGSDKAKEVKIIEDYVNGVDALVK